jgi:hypothetical protein
MAAVESLYCEHGRTSAACEACAHAAARADGRRAPVTRKELYPFPNGGALTTGWLPEQPPAEPEPPAKGRRS